MLHTSPHHELSCVADASLQQHPATNILEDRPTTCEEDKADIVADKHHEDTFLVCDGCIPAGGDLLVTMMSVEDAKLKCSDLPGCCGFTFQAASPEGNACIYFKKTWSIVPVEGSTWTSYRYVKADCLHHPLSAELLVHVALQPHSNVDFPQITEVCDRIEADSQDMTVATSLLIAVLCGPAGFREKLKVLTIMHEMLYNNEVVAQFRCSPCLKEALGSLQATQDTGLGAAADENIRMLATEIGKACTLRQSSSLSSSNSSVSPPSCHRRRRLPSALPSALPSMASFSSTSSAAKLRSVVEKKTVAMMESVEKVAAESLSSALVSAEKTADTTAYRLHKALADAEKTVDMTASSLHKAFKDVNSFVVGELNSSSSLKSAGSSLKSASRFRPTLPNFEFSESQFSWDGSRGWNVERNRQIPCANLQHVQWERHATVS